MFLLVPAYSGCPGSKAVFKRSSSRHGLQEGTGQTRHHVFNDIIWRAFGAAGIPAVKEPSGLDRQDGKRPDELTLIPWHSGHSLVWELQSSAH